jgi:hypothetical protein
MNEHEFTFLASVSDRPGTRADFTYNISLTMISIFDTGLGASWVSEDIEAVLRKIEYWLLLCLIAARADELPMINDSEAFSVSRQSRRGARLSLSGPNQPTRDHIYKFRPRIPNQTFAGFIASAQESLTLVARKSVPLLMAAFSLILTASHAHAGLGWTLAQFKEQYGEPVLNQEQIAGRIGYVFKGKEYAIAAFFLNRKASRILYICRSGSVFSWATARALLDANAPDAIWADPFKNEADNFYRVNATKDGVETYYATLTDDGMMLAIWTKEDDEAGRTSPKLDTLPLSSVMGWNEKSTREITAGQAPSIDSGLTPKINQPDVQANATSRSPAQQPNSATAAHTKAPHRSSVHRRYVDVKTRLIALWHQSLKHEKSRDGTLFSNSNKGARKKVGYTAETRY